MPRPRSSRVIWNGNPGEVWKNDTGIIRYQLICDFHHSCGVCIQYHLAISNWWPIPFHRSCRCRNLPISIGATAQPFRDWREIIEGLGWHAKVEAIGASNWKLLEAGTIEWGDVVTPTRVRSLREVVADRNLSRDQLSHAGVRDDIAERAYAKVHSPKAGLVREARQQALKDLESAGISRHQVYKQVTEHIAQRVSIGAGPSGPSVMPAKIVGPKPAGGLPSDILAALNRFRTPDILSPPRSEPFHEKVTRAAESVPQEKLYGDDKVWIHHVYEAFQADKSNPRMTLAEFKSALLEYESRANLKLGVADLVQVHDPKLIEASNTEYFLSGAKDPTATFNFVRRKKR